MREEGHTSQFSRIKQRPPATDLSGPKASAESLTPRRSNLAVADAVDFQFDFFSFVATLGSAFSSGLRTPGLSSEEGSGAATETIAPTYCRVSHHTRAKEWMERDKLARCSLHHRIAEVDPSKRIASRLRWPRSLLGRHRRPLQCEALVEEGNRWRQLSPCQRRSRFCPVCVYSSLTDA
jgi:hypothetical protein